MFSWSSVGQKSTHAAVQWGPQLTRLKSKVLTKLNSYVKALTKISLPSSFRFQTEFSPLQCLDPWALQVQGNNSTWNRI